MIYETMLKAFRNQSSVHTLPFRLKPILFVTPVTTTIVSTLNLSRLECTLTGSRAINYRLRVHTHRSDSIFRCD